MGGLFMTRIHFSKTRLFKYIENFTSKNWKFPEKKKKNSQTDIFHISAQNIDCGYSLEPPRRGGSNEYPQSMFLSKNKKSNVYPCKSQFYYVKVGFKGIIIIEACFRDWWLVYPGWFKLVFDSLGKNSDCSREYIVRREIFLFHHEDTCWESRRF